MLLREVDVLQLYAYETECLFPHFYLLLNLSDLIVIPDPDSRGKHPTEIL